jgi:anaerobic ribonucleoside-triphosphate reductase activating protein
VPDSITDGPGIRTAVFVQGCPHGCVGCHNPASHDFSGGTDTTVDDLFCQIARNPLLSGVTFTGGEPLCQAEALAELAERVKALGLEVAVYTGYTWEELAAEQDAGRMALLRQTDTLIDGRFELAQRSLELKFKGSRNQRILHVQKSLAAGKPVLEQSKRWV